MLYDAAGFKHVYLCTGYTDLRKGVPGLAAMVQATFGLDPTEEGSIFLFCGRRTDRIKALLYEPLSEDFCYPHIFYRKAYSLIVFQHFQFKNMRVKI